MNYFAHGRWFVDDPYFLAGTAVPDWLNVVDRKLRVRSRHAERFVDTADPQVAALAKGIVRHHEDDRWFHQTPAFVELCIALTRHVREVLPPSDSLRPSFLGHILVEILLDAELIDQQPSRLDSYYRAIDGLDPRVVADAVGRMAARPADGLAELIPGFSAARFLWDYLEDAKLCFRLNQVMRRVGLPELPDSFAAVIPAARRMVGRRSDELLTR